MGEKEEQDMTDNEYRSWWTAVYRWDRQESFIAGIWYGWAIGLGTMFLRDILLLVLG
jgi:hypothetical protein